MSTTSTGRLGGLPARRHDFARLDRDDRDDPADEQR